MKAAFIWTPDVARLVGDATATHKALPRAKRKALRYTPTKQRTNHNTKTSLSTDTIVDTWLAIHDPMNDKDYYCMNTADCDMGMDEFGDIDDEYAGLTIVTPGRNTRRWLKGYNIL